MGVNKVFLIGNLGKDPELRYTANKHPVCNLNIATTEPRKGTDGSWTDHTEWHTVVTFGRTAENCSQYLKKGRQVFVEGKIQTRKWQDKDGNNRYTTEVIANTVQFIGGKGESTGGGRSQAADYGEPFETSNPIPSAEPVAFSDDDIPF